MFVFTANIYLLLFLFVVAVISIVAPLRTSLVVVEGFSSERMLAGIARKVVLQLPSRRRPRGGSDSELFWNGSSLPSSFDYSLKSENNINLRLNSKHFS